MDQTYHFIAAEKLLAAGVEVVQRISHLAGKRQYVTYGTPGHSPDTYARYTQEMDELGKKVMGIWAQAQVHATLAHVPDEHVGALLELNR